MKAPAICRESSEQFWRNIDMQENILEIKFEVDDMTGEEMGGLFEILAKAGALDVSASPVVMKKNRPGYSFTVLCDEKSFGLVTDTIFMNSSTFGFRYIEKKRIVLEREIKSVILEGMKVGVKIGRWKGAIVSIAPEYDDCLRLAKETKKSLRQIIDLAKSKITEND